MTRYYHFINVTDNSPKNLQLFTQKVWCFKHHVDGALGNFMRKVENAEKQHYLLFLQCFQPYEVTNLTICARIIVLSANPLHLDKH